MSKNNSAAQQRGKASQNKVLNTIVNVVLILAILLGVFCSCIAATPPYSVIPPTNCEVIELSNNLGALQVGGSSRKPHLLLCDYIAVCKGEQFPYLCVGFQMEVGASN